MRLHTCLHRTFEHGGTLIAFAAACSLPLVAQTQTAPAPLPKSATVAASALEHLLPAPVGWTKGRVIGNRVEVSDTCAYSFADGIYTNGTMKIRLTIADTVANPEGLAIVATMVVTLADDYSTTIDRTTTIKRLSLNGSPAALRWSSATLDGEFLVVIGGRFVAKAEGSGMAGVDVLQGFVEQVDLKALAQLK